MYPLQIHQRCTAIVLNNRKCIESFCKVEVMFGSAVVQQAINFVMWKHCTRAIARDDSIDTELEVTIYINYINKQQSIQRLPSTATKCTGCCGWQWHSHTVSIQFWQTKII